MNADQHGWRTRKQELRSEIRVALKTFSSEKRAADSAKARAILLQQNFWKSARAILFFAPLPEELDVWPLVETALIEGKIVALPRFDAGTNRYVAHQIQDAACDVESGKFGIREPKHYCPSVPLNRLDFSLVPGVAFDLRGRRLGRGKGFYDQLLAGISGKTCGVGFDEQIIAEIPVEPHDIHLNCILTPTRWIEP
jgi:5-formyltetrahydrofolate cyclo-ligase